MNQNYSTSTDNRPGITASPKPTPSVELAFSRLEESQERLMKAFSVLASKIQPVCRQLSSPPERNGKEVENPGCQIAERLAGAAQVNENLVSQIEECTNRIEL